MIPPLRFIPRLNLLGDLPTRCFASTASYQGRRIAVYRGIQRNSNHDRIAIFPQHPTVCLVSKSHPFHNIILRNSFSTTPRATAISFRDLKSDDKPHTPPPKEAPQKEAEIDPAEEAYRRATRDNYERAKAEREKERERVRREEEEKTKGESSEESAGEGEKKEEKDKQPPPPPPPHGTKSPWQVFTETLKSEFKASKEWNESTKQLASSAHNFTENESVKRARAAYSAASGAATSGTASALKNTGKALGQGAAWTWDSSVVKGVRAGANAAGRGIDKATQPIRDTSAYKSVKNVVDDGSSSRYGGWLEKEERRKRREQRELEESSTGRGAGGRKAEKMEEDPEYVSFPTLQASFKFVCEANKAIGRVRTSPSTRIPTSTNGGAPSRTPPL